MTRARITMLNILISLALIVLVAAPAYAQQGIVPCTDNCSFRDLIGQGGGLADRVLQWLVSFTVALGTLSFAIAGFMLMTSAGNDSRRTQAKEIATNTVIGIVLAAAAYIIIRFILFALTGGRVSV